MKYTAEKLAELQKELAGILKEVQSGKLTMLEAADKIIHVKGEIDDILNHLQMEARKKLIKGN
jgi:hypothetical protein